MRTFSSYGPVDKHCHYYVPREMHIETIYKQLTEGHYLTVWAPRQCGKTWIMNEVYRKLCENNDYCALKIDLENLKLVDHTETIIKNMSQRIIKKLKLPIHHDIDLNTFDYLFSNEMLEKPLILILDEFDALDENAIAFIVSIFRHIYNTRLSDNNTLLHEKEYLLHGVALIGVRSVIGIENDRGSPFNIQRSIHIPNLSYDETKAMFHWYEKETGHILDQDVIEKIYHETSGHPALVSWFGELITEGYEAYVPDKTKPITMKDFDEIYSDAIHILPNNTILNIISKATQTPYNELILDLFNTKMTIPFRFDDKLINYLYLNGVIDYQVRLETKMPSVKFSSPFVQTRLFNYYSYEYFKNMDDLITPFEDMSNIVTSHAINIKNLLIRYEQYLKKTSHWLLKNAPRRSDLKIYEAIYHFNLYKYLVNFFENYEISVWPEFPTGNGKVDLIIAYSEKIYALEIKSYKDKPGFDKAIKQASKYAQTLKLNRIYLVIFVENIDETNRSLFEKTHHAQDMEIDIEVVFIDLDYS